MPQRAAHQKTTLFGEGSDVLDGIYRSIAQELGVDDDMPDDDLPAPARADAGLGRLDDRPGWIKEPGRARFCGGSEDRARPVRLPASHRASAQARPSRN